MKFALKTENNSGPLVYVEINQQESNKLLEGFRKTQSVAEIPVRLTLSNTEQQYELSFGASNTKQLLGISIVYLAKEAKEIVHNLTYSYSPENSQDCDDHAVWLNNFQFKS